jgi:hypothetical protein
MKQAWDKDRIVRALRQLHKAGKELSYNRLSRSMQPLVSAAAYHFGSFQKAVEQAGIDYEQVRRRPRWTKVKIIQVIKKARREGQDLYWSAVIQRRDELGKAAFAALQPRLFGNWVRALHAAGLDADDISRYRHWDRHTIIAELKQRYRDDEPLNSGALQREDPGAHAAALRHFGGYDQALKAAGLKPEELRRRKRWSHDAVVRELKGFQRRHRELSAAALRRNAPALYGAVLRYFKTLGAARERVKKK